MELLTVQETAKIVRVAPITVRRYIAQGRLPAVRVGRRFRVRKEAVEQMAMPVVPGPLGQGRASRRKGQPLHYDDSLWSLVGSAKEAQPTDASKKHEYLASGPGL